MSFYIRKSVKFGPIRFNISKSGIGISTGVKGARISTGPLGTYINLGRNGIYYRQKIDGSILEAPSETGDDNFHQSETANSSIPTADVTDLVDTSNKDLLDQINSRIQLPIYGNLVSVFTIVITFFLCVLSFFFSNSLILLVLLLALTFLILLAGLEVASVTKKQELLARTTTLQYKLEEDVNKKFTRLQNALDALSKSKRIWRVISRTSTWDWKRNAGATSLINRIPVQAKIMSPPFIETQITVYGLLLDAMQIYFLPDQVFIFQNGKYGAISYDSLQINVMPTRFIEEENVPDDAQIVDSTWRYPRKDGGPDKRFSNNHQIPIAQYGYFELLSQNGLNLHFHISNLLNTQLFSQALLDYIRYCQAPNSRTYSNKNSSGASNQSTKEPPAESTNNDESPYEVLKISSNASWDEISSAYKKMVQMYHPDKVANLAPEYKEIAESRMRIINAAYERLERKFNK